MITAPSTAEWGMINIGVRKYKIERGRGTGQVRHNPTSYCCALTLYARRRLKNVEIAFFFPGPRTWSPRVLTAPLGLHRLFWRQTS